jgi:hypothetical protein
MEADEGTLDLPFDPMKMPDPDFVMPDLVDPVIGWRSWQVTAEIPHYGVPPKLYSVTHAGHRGVSR